LLHADRFGLSAEPLNFSGIFRTDSRIRSALKYRSGMACVACLPLGDIPSPKPAAFPNQEELRVRQADGGANDQSNSDLPTISSRRTDLLADGGLRQMHALGGAREALGLATATKAVQFAPATPPGFHSDRHFIPRTGALVRFVNPRCWISAESVCPLDG
jgi:hypothetical protein